MFRFTKINNYEVLNLYEKDFFTIVKNNGYFVNTNPDFHQFFMWKNIKKTCFLYEHLNNKELYNIFRSTIIYKNNIEFYILLLINKPLIRVNFQSIAEVLEDISFYEVSSGGWSAISVCGKYIFEFMDEYEGIFVGNFEIPDYKDLLDPNSYKWAPGNSTY